MSYYEMLDEHYSFVDFAEGFKWNAIGWALREVSKYYDEHQKQAADDRAAFIRSLGIAEISFGPHTES